MHELRHEGIEVVDLILTLNALLEPTWLGLGLRGGHRVNVGAVRDSDEGEVALGVAARVQLTAHGGVGLGFEIGFDALAPAHLRA